MVDKIDDKIDALKEETDEKFKNNIKVREALKVEYMTERVHQLVCQATQAELKAHISKTATDNRKIMSEKIDRNLGMVKDMFDELKESLRKNGVI